MKFGRGPTLRLGAAAGAAFLGGSACKCAQDRPYTPFHITPSTSAQDGAAPEPSSSGAPNAPAFPRVAVPAPPDVSDWSLDGVVLGVDKERKFDRAVTADFDGDGSREAVAWTRARAEPPDAQATGELVFFGKGAPAGRVLAKIPAFVPVGPGCRHTVALFQTGPRTVTLDIGAHCDATLVPRSPTRGLMVIAPTAERPEVLSLRIADPAPGESFDIGVDSNDRDGDGLDDVRVITTMKSAPDDSGTTADLVWLDRAAGPSRDAGEPAHSLAKTALGEAIHGTGKRKSDKIPLQIGDARRLYATLCAESGTARIFDADGAPLTCRETDEALTELLVGEVRTSLAQRDPLSAAAALGRDGWFGAPLPSKRKAALERQLLAAAPLHPVSEQLLDVIPKAKSGVPRFSPLAFETDGSLLVETEGAGISRFRLPDAKPENADTDAWPLTTGSGTDPRWMGLAFPCDRSEVALLLSDSTGAPEPSQPTTILAPRPGSCGRRGVNPTLDLLPLEWTADRKVGLIGNALFGAATLSELPSIVTRGSPRSPDGKTMVGRMPIGLLVLSHGKAETWSAADSTGLSDCVVANGGAAVACIRGTRPAVFTPAAPAAKK